MVAAPMVEVDKQTDEENYQLGRIENGVAEGSTEIPKGSFLFLSQISFTLDSIVGLSVLWFCFWDASS